MIAIRSAISSASFMFCSIRRIVTPPSGHVCHPDAGDEMRRPAGDVPAAEQHPAGAWRQETHNRTQCRGFTDAVPPEDRRDRAVRHLEVYALKNVAGSVMGVEAFE